MATPCNHRNLLVPSQQRPQITVISA
uniref:Uncharacterized protein n=1 Tax=Anguilla anguilla TaxID=7936 RepID=A0A0E9SPT2_ANGAN